jgi:hypothetical protein
MALETNSMRWLRYVAHRRELRNIYKNLVEVSEYKMPSGGHKCRNEYNIKVEPHERWIHLAQDMK